MTIHANNYYPKHIHIFRSVTIEFLANDDGHQQARRNSSIITYHNQHDDQFEMARAMMFDLQNQIASQLKIRLHFDGNWILISEITFDSFIVSSPTITTTTTTTATSTSQTTATSIPLLSNKSSYHFWIYIIICLSTMAIILMLGAIILLIRRTLNEHQKLRKHYFTPIHNHTNSSTSTTSSDIDFNSTQHRYATIGPAQPYLLCTNGSIRSSSSPHYAKLMPPTTTLLRTPSLIQQNHVEGICGNSALSTPRMFTFDMNENQFLPLHQIKITRKLDIRKQLIGGGEVSFSSMKKKQSFKMFVYSDLSR